MSLRDPDATARLTLVIPTTLRTRSAEIFVPFNGYCADNLRDVRAEGGVAILAHPIRRAVWLALLDGIELWNRKSDGISWGREALEMIATHGLPATVGHDFYRRRQIWPLSQRFDLSDAPDTADALGTALVLALRAGDSSPFAFGRRLRGDGGLPSRLPYPALERARCGLRDLRDRVWRRARF